MAYNDNQLYPYTKTTRNSEYSSVNFPRNSSDPRYSQMMNQRQSTWNPAPVHQQNPAMSMSHTQPFQYQSSSTTQLAAAPKNTGTDKTANENSKFNCSKLCEKLTPTKILFFLVGLTLCAIPLAVMTTQWVYASADSGTTSTTAKVTVTNASSATSIPFQCYAYSSLTDSTRLYANGYGCCYSPSDNSATLTPGWYRISGSAGTQLYTSVITTTGICGASYGGYFNGSLPSTVGALTTGNVCFYTGSICSYSLSPISVINCNGYYIYSLIPTPNTNYRFCTIT